MAMSATDIMESYFASSSRGRITGPISRGGSPNLTINTAMLQSWGDNSLMERNYLDPQGWNAAE